MSVTDSIKLVSFNFSLKLVLDRLLLRNDWFIDTNWKLNFNLPNARFLTCRHYFIEFVQFKMPLKRDAQKVKKARKPNCDFHTVNFLCASDFNASCCCRTTNSVYLLTVASTNFDWMKFFMFRNLKDLVETLS